MNDIGEQIGSQLNNSPQLSNSINSKMDTLESKWNVLLEKMEYLSKICTEQQQIELSQEQKPRHHILQPIDEHTVQIRNNLAHTVSLSTIISNTRIHTNVINEDDEAVPVVEDNIIERKILKNHQMNEEEIKNFKSIDEFVAHINFLFEKINSLIESLKELSLDEQQEIIQVNL